MKTPEELADKYVMDIPVQASKYILAIRKVFIKAFKEQIQENKCERIQELESNIQEFLMAVDHGTIDPCVIILDFEAKFKQLLEA